MCVGQCILRPVGKICRCRSVFTRLLENAFFSSSFSLFYGHIRPPPFKLSVQFVKFLNSKFENLSSFSSYLSCLSLFMFQYSVITMKVLVPVRQDFTDGLSKNTEYLILSECDFAHPPLAAFSFVSPSSYWPDQVVV